MAPRREFYKLWASNSGRVAGEARELFGVLYNAEQEA